MFSLKNLKENDTRQKIIKRLYIKRRELISFSVGDRQKSTIEVGEAYRKKMHHKHRLSEFGR